MVEASWEGAATPDVDWRMSAALENVPRGGEELAEVTSLEGAVRAWMALDPQHRSGATLTPERPLLVDGASLAELRGEHIGTLAALLPGRASADQPGLDDAG